jgi:succinate dehydrogenase/fumarate reductase cytochrome b subunit
MNAHDFIAVLFAGVALAGALVALALHLYGGLRLILWRLAKHRSKPGSRSPI